MENKIKIDCVVGIDPGSNGALAVPSNAYLQYLGNSPAKAYDDESYAYFAGWVSNCMWSVLNNKPELMKGVKVE